NSASWCFGGYGGPSKIFARDTSVDGGGVRDLGHPHFDELYEPVGFGAFYVFAWIRCCNERSRVAGNHAGRRFGAASRSRRGVKFRRIQCGSLGWSSAGRGCRGRNRIGMGFPFECSIVLWSHLFPLSVETPAPAKRRSGSSA